MLNEIAAIQAPYIIESTETGWRVARVGADPVASDEAEAVTHRDREVALAYAQAAAALERYLASRDRCEDSAELFDAWRALDDRYEMMSIERDDAPMRMSADPWAAAATLH